MEDDSAKKKVEWRTAQGDLTDEEWALIEDLFTPYWSPGKMGRPIKHNRRDIVNAIFYVLSTGCQWRSLPANYPHWNTVHRYHLTWSTDGIWQRASERLRVQVRVLEQRDGVPSAGIIDARTVRGTAMVSAATRGYDAGKKISGRKTFGVVDTLGLLIAVLVVTANTSDNVGGMAVVDAARTSCPTLRKLWCDGGFKKTFVKHCNDKKISAEVVNRIHARRFVTLPRRWVVERSWSWIMNNRRLQVDYERTINAVEGFIWASQTRTLLRRLTTR